MDIMALIAVMICSYMFLFKVLGHGYHLYRFFWPCPDDLVMAAQAKLFDFLPLFLRQFGNNLAILDMIGHRPMAKLAGNRFMDTLQMHFPNMGMTNETRGVRAVSNGPIELIING